MDFAVNVIADGCEHSIAWLGLQPDGAVSVGLNDRAFISPRFQARQDLWNVDNRVTVQYLVPDTQSELRPVINPHLTFHPPIYIHLHANGDQELFAGIAEVEITLEQDARVPWVRFVSRTVRDLPPARAPRNPERTTVIRIPVDPDVSVGFALDFVRLGASVPSGTLLDRFIDHRGNRLHLFCEALHPQQATLAWYHQY